MANQIWKQKPADGVNENGQPIVAGNGGSQNFRIPCIVTLDDGTIVASADARWNAEMDGGGMDIVVSYSKDMGKTWYYTYANYLGDNGDVYDDDSSTLMDPALATDGKRIYLLVDLFAGGCSAFRGTLVNGDGFTENKCLRVRKKGDTKYNYYLKEGKIYSSDDTVVENCEVDEWFHITIDGIYAGNLFYTDSPYKVYPTSYLCFTTSDDSGKTWSAPYLIDNVKRIEDAFYGTGPGRGLVTKDGTLMFSCYDGKYASVIFSKDKGKTWNRFGQIKGTESQPVELLDGTIRIFFRNFNDVICYADAVKEGDTYVIKKTVHTNVSNCSYCMISAIRYSQKINGKEAILVSCPSVVGTWNGRYNGRIFVFTLDSENNMVLVDTYAINGKEKKEFFAYSCMTELGDGKIGLLYEDSCIHYQGSPQGVGYSRVVYRQIEIKEIVPEAVIE